MLLNVRRTYQWIWAFVCIILATILPYWTLSSWQPIERLAQDMQWRVGHILLWNKLPEQRIVFVDIDERSLQAKGAWPWSRTNIAQLIERLIQEGGAQVVVLDIVFPEFKLGDEKLFAALSQDRVYQAVVYGKAGSVAPSSLKQIAKPYWTRETVFFKEMSIALANNVDLQTPRVGHINPYYDQDGVIRFVPSILCVKDNCHAPLALTVMAGLMQVNNATVQQSSWWKSKWELVMGDIRVPINESGMIPIPYFHSRNSWTAIPAYQVLDGDYPKEMVEGKIILVGSTAFGLSDRISTPLSSVASGIEVHAELLSGLLDGELMLPIQHFWLIYGVIFLSITALFIRWERRLEGFAKLSIYVVSFLFLSAAVITSLWILVCWWFYILLPFTPIILFFPLMMLGLLGLEWFSSDRSRRKVESVLNTYMPRDVAKVLIHETRSEEDVDAQERFITVLYADILGFSAFAEGRSPEVIATFTQEVFRGLSKEIVQLGGTIDKFMGDSVLAFWNAPHEQENHAHLALEAAKGIRQKIKAMQPWAKTMGFDNLQIGVGIESGLSLVGHFGSKDRRTYTALGEPVVLATRIEELTRQLPHKVLCGPVTAELLGDDRVQFVKTVPVRGRALGLRVYTLR